jgi:hypothetical protein
MQHKLESDAGASLTSAFYEKLVLLDNLLGRVSVYIDTFQKTSSASSCHVSNYLSNVASKIIKPLPDLYQPFRAAPGIELDPQTRFRL